LSPTTIIIEPTHPITKRIYEAWGWIAHNKKKFKYGM
jgi:hypothetical protein